ncbi:hypothetical protein ADEAN_000111500 [Angomonas deanei]|uniref:Uncharacterized protein n=1 Tax=Angomonas deanei TaxID=59799 RepID=A0A7G2C6U4_9TRYP|nr:hypothetical protein ADEAN_000111500 [Angomonas deanei]
MSNGIQLKRGSGSARSDASNVLSPLTRFCKQYEARFDDSGSGSQPNRSSANQKQNHPRNDNPLYDPTEVQAHIVRNVVLPSVTRDQRDKRRGDSLTKRQKRRRFRMQHNRDPLPSGGVCHGIVTTLLIVLMVLSVAYVYSLDVFFYKKMDV